MAVISLMGGSLAFPDTSQAIEQKDELTQLEEAAREEDMNVTINEMSVDELKQISGYEEQVFLSQNINKKLSDGGYREVTSDEVKNFKISDNKEDGVFTYNVYHVFENQNNDVVILQTVYDSVRDKIVSVYGEQDKKDSKDSKQRTEFVNYMDFSVNNMSRKSFTWNGRSFACSATGVLACVSYCFTWAMVHPAAGVVCDVACGAVFAWACSFA